MNAELNQFLSGILADIMGGLIAGLVGWFAHSIYEKHRRKRSHAQFDRDIFEFSHAMRDAIPHEQIPELMALVVPLASRARFGVDMPPLKEEHTLPIGVVLHCKICKQSVEPTTEGRCKTCKLTCGLWHEPVPKT